LAERERARELDPPIPEDAGRGVEERFPLL